MATVHRKLKRLVTALVMVEVILFTCWRHGIESVVFGSLGVIQSWTPVNDESSPLLPPLQASKAVSMPSEPLLKVYVYDNIPESLSLDVLEPCVLESSLRNVPKKRDNFMADVSIIRLFQTYPGRTYDPNEADLFVVSYAHKTNCLCNLNFETESGKECPQVPEHDIHQLLSRLTYLNETTVRRHLFIASNDYGWCNPILESAPLLLTLGPKPKTKDGNIVIPYLNSRREYQPSVLRQQEWNFTQRNISFAYFYGDAVPRKLRPIFRKEVKQTYGTNVGGLPFVVGNIKKWTSERQNEVYTTYRQSIFCPCLPGDNAPQKRFFDVIMSGCLPVVLSFNTSEGGKSWFRPDRASVESSYPFAKGMFDESVEIDYESFVVQVPNDVTKIKAAMEALLADPAELRRRQENMGKYAPLLTYGLGKEAHKYDDAFSRIVGAIRHYLNGLNDANAPMIGNDADILLQHKTSKMYTLNTSGVVPFGIRDTRGMLKALRNKSKANANATLGPGIDRDSLPDGPKTSPRPHLTDRLLSRFIVVPERKLLFCYVEKVGCSMFNHLFRMLRLSLPEVARNTEEASFQANFTWYRNTPSHHGLNKTQLEDLLVNPNWTKAVFYRDPVTRFLSAYRSKCEVGHDTTPDCRNVFGKQFASFDEALARMTDGQMPKNPHFAQASSFCGGLDATLDYYDVVHQLRTDTAPVHVQGLLERVGVDSETTKALVDAIVRTRGAKGDHERELATRLGIEIGFGRTQKENHNTEANQNLCEYYNTTEKVASIMKIYRKDYETFQLSPRGVNCASPTGR